ncbi:GAF domain-containing protein [Haloterrigena sp. SYSU A558-1]|uniref:GAF domain-containing protein n=1 Tax=Haloterrigena gelatinilytica TaxID=2741724 RepID=A0A8J8KH20_9EURY|nr:bacterio-opsin activator domain-containing protein [Haloterrigena gelatinilytica]NUB93086.1 GAF domain-containing protein [Haloterrigena gelatinilytica]NUC71004.1 GAF domain-containing protein [Haloterrigena gelatinilytica]
MVTAGIDDGGTVLVVEPSGADPASLLDSLDSRRSEEKVSSAAAALEALETRSVDCVLTPQSVADATGLELVERIRDRDPDVPIVLAPREGNGGESLAGDAIAAGVTEYVPADRDASALEAAVERAIEAGRDRRERRERARQFGAVFDDPETYAWVLETDGRVRRANERALEASGTPDAAGADVRGEPFADLPLWNRLEEDRSTIRTAVDRAATGAVVHREVTLELDRGARANGGGTDTDAGVETETGTGADTADDPRTLEVTVRPVRDDSGAVVSLLARANDVTERARLERELRESEELHRVTLNNMTDTVLIADDDGEFTYVCPNVHFIFGYTDEEIYEMGTIDDLLGSELFDREELEREGVLTNIECTATDRAGREHTLLVNVREVSIQGGTTLYSCRDVTTRKRREEALTALHRTARELLYAESDREIADRVAADAADVLDLEASGVYLFDSDENVLEPVAASPGMNRLHGPLSRHPVGEDSVSGRAFIDGESRFFADVRDAEALADPTTDIRGAAVVPLGDHGVFLAGSSERDAFDAVDRELTDLLAATAEAALDRVERERSLRERDRELKRQNRRLTRLDRINEIIREIDAALVRAETREEIETAVCERLTAADRFAFAWIGTTDAPGERLEPNTHDGTGRGRDYLDGVSLSLSEAAEPAARAAADGEVTVVSNVADGLREEPWRSAALSREYQSVAGVPLAYDEFAYGVLAVYADRPDAFDEVTRSVLAELGETIASAIAAVERKRALLTDSRTRLEFDVGDDGFVFSRLARRADCVLSFDGGVRLHEDGAAVFATVEGAPADAVVAAATDLVAVEGARAVGAGDGETEAEATDDHGGTVLLELAPPFLALRLADHGVVLRSVEASPDGARVVVDVPPTVDAGNSVDVVSNAFDDVDLHAKRTVDRTTAQDLRSELLERLTERQLEVVQLAYYGGYFESPREQSGEEMADALGISSAAFYRHVRAVQRKLFVLLFDELGLPANAAPGVE